MKTVYIDNTLDFEVQVFDAEKLQTIAWVSGAVRSSRRGPPG